jgi:DNA transformation protein
MAVSPSFKAFVVEQLSRGMPGIRTRNMFGGVGIYAGDAFFALIDDDTLYFKVDDATRPTYNALGMGPFRPFGDEGAEMQYYQVAEELLEDPHALASWAADAVAVARRTKRKPRRRRT